MRCERGQATIEWTGLVLLVALALGALATVGPSIDGRSFGGFLAHRIVCAVRGGCDDGDAALARAYGRRDAELVRAMAPNITYEEGERSLPVDWRECRARSCSDAPDDRDLDAHRSDASRRATVFVRVIRRGRRKYIQYWLYYPDSNTTFLASDKLWDRSYLRWFARYPGFHADDWEGYAIRIGPDGSVWARSTSHGHWQGCKSRACRSRWTRHTGWTRVSRGSHAGHIPPGLPGRDVRERTTTGDGLRLVPLETLDRSGYVPLDEDVEPPWEKLPYRDPEDDQS